MKILIVFLITLAVGVSGLNLADVPCGQVGSGTRRIFQRIMGGAVADITDFPYTVSMKKHGKHHCVGSLINKNYVLTAAHCLKGTYEDIWTITVGDERQSQTDGHERNFKVENFKIHQQFEMKKASLFDIALIKLSEPVEWSDHVQPICLPDVDSESFAGKQGLLAGWGLDKEAKDGGQATDDLHFAKLPILSRSTCKSMYDKYNEDEQKHVRILDEHVCAGHVEGLVDGCWGDSGGALVSQSEDHQMVVIGVVSGSVGCGRPNIPGIYTDVPSYVGWINSTISGWESSVRAPREAPRFDWTGMEVSRRLALLKRDFEAELPASRFPGGLPVRSLSY